MSMTLALIHLVETNPIRVSYRCISYLFTVTVAGLKQLYLSNKMDLFSYKGGRGVVMRMYTY